jgi:NADPH-dependent 2,4-dienoyl-CoA reductase/sulfur reductase-like enzyme
MIEKDIVVIGGGAAGLAAISKLSEVNALLIERTDSLGGILNQCIHNGFGLGMFNEELTGPEYANRFINDFEKLHIDYMLSTTVLKIEHVNNFFILTTSGVSGINIIKSKALILGTGCYERTRGAIMIPGDRPKGVVPAGSAQRYLNIDGYLVGKKIFILGSGDIGLIMARRMTLEGAKVLGVAEIMSYSNGLNRNIVQCLNDFDIPLYLSHTVSFIEGKDKVEAINIVEVDKNFNPIPGTEKRFECDTLLLSVGLVPDVTLLDNLSSNKSNLTKSLIVNQNYESSIPGLFACGNVLHVHDLVDNVSMESMKAGSCALNYIVNQNNIKPRLEVDITTNKNIRYTVPQKIDFNNLNNDFDIMFRVTNKFKSGVFKVIQNGVIIKKVKAAHLVPAEMCKISMKVKDFVSQDAVEVVLEDVL